MNKGGPWEKGPSHSAVHLDSLRGLTFDDVFIVPRHTDVTPVEVDLSTVVCRGLSRELPLVSAPMDDVFSPSLAAVLDSAGALATLPRSFPVSLIGRAEPNEDRHRRVVVASASPADEQQLNSLLGNPAVNYVIVDTATGFQENIVRFVAAQPEARQAKLIIGNIVTGEGADAFARFPIAALRVGLGAGSICTTTELTGIGVPQLHAIQEVANVARPHGIPVIADGGIRSTGDIAKALAAGAQSVMLGRMFAATTEAGGEQKEIDGTVFKAYSATPYESIELRDDTGDLELDQQVRDLLEKLRHRTEGVSGYVRHIGSARVLLLHIKKALQASFAMVGARNLSEFQNRARFIAVSRSARAQAGAHGIEHVREANRLL